MRRARSPSMLLKKFTTPEPRRISIRRITPLSITRLPELNHQSRTPGPTLPPFIPLHITPGFIPPAAHTFAVRPSPFDAIAITSASRPVPLPMATSLPDDVTTGEDPVVRQAAIDALGDMNGTAVVINPSNGRILAMVNQKLALSPGAEPCSTIKITVAMAALSEGLVTARHHGAVARLPHEHDRRRWPRATTSTLKSWAASLALSAFATTPRSSAWASWPATTFPASSWASIPISPFPSLKAAWAACAASARASR